MTSPTTTSGHTPLTAAARTPRQLFLDAYEREHEKTMRVLRAFPTDQTELRPHEKSKTARELAWVFVLERGLGKAVLDDALAKGKGGSGMPPAPGTWNEVLG